ncbi:hypothetical protein [Streptomyces montanus]|nr:hypothetical protein [Streptomyces montanus]
MTYTTVDPALVIEDDLTVQCDATRSSLPRRPRLRPAAVGGSVRRTDGVA